RDADAARVRAKLKAARAPAGGVFRPSVSAPDAPAPAPDKRKRDRKATRAASRRRSTLSPWELQTLISGEAPGGLDGPTDPAA
ncbi:hypothetical protein E4U42_000625, partial [Claviceps africana]